MAETTISSKQIRDAAITNAKIAAGAGIDSSKLADGANFTKKDGSVAYTGNQSMGNNKITSMANGTVSTDGVNKGQLDAAIGALNSAYKYRNVRAVATTNISTSSAPSSIDGVTLTSGDQVLLTGQTTQSQNGLYDFSSAGAALSRSADSDSWAEIIGALVSVNEGTTYADSRWFCTANSGGTLNTTAITYTQDVSNGLVSSNFVDDETPSGAINGSNTSYTLAFTPVAGTLDLYLNGFRQKSGAGNDYTISGNTITMTTAPVTGDLLTANYRK